MLKPVVSAGPRPLMEDKPRAGAFTAKVLTLYPEMFPGALGHSLTGKALQAGLWALDALDIRRFARDKHRTVDDRPAGGGPGMVLKPEIVAAAIDEAQRGIPDDRTRWPVFALSPRGRRFDQGLAQAIARAEGVTLLCGRFEGIDERVLEARRIEELSVGDFVLTGGEIAAMTVLDAVLRLIPGVLGNEASAVEESFSRGLLEHPQYTRPTVWEGRAIPEILLSGHHARIAEWRLARAEALTQARRPDLWRAYRGASKPGGGTDGDRELSDATPTAGKGGTEKD
ncbi:tRNA (guanosine(37)-N1)-methyltransferase TrmD [Paralimibaculum aggregatum]|nr:tRNA (guanosine(37)-N1)-methyltransferase TrmD [Limibaculum sp. NKW23]